MMRAGPASLACRAAIGVALAIGLSCGPVLTAPRTPAAGAVEFNRDVRPILSDKCFACHGPDDKKRAAGLRLDDRESATAVRPGGHRAVTPGRPETSRAWVRIAAADPSQRMPPPQSRLALTEKEKRVLRLWIEQGARYQAHWAYVPLPGQVTIPRAAGDRWSRNEIDHFVLDRLKREGLRPAPEASGEAWLRRVTLDLTGVPPTPAEADAFLADRSAAAHDRVVDRLLLSPRYGERMAAAWLDLARYADSYGYQSDQLSPTWPYRDWVVRAFNQNLPFDQFLTWQLAGDLLPNPTRDQRLATAFNRLHRMTNEGGSVPEEWRLEGVADRVHTFGTAFLGLTLECARCHDHKFDPFSQREYYALASFFSSIDEHGLYDRADIVPSPSLLLPTPDQEKLLADARARLAAAENELAELKVRRGAEFIQWLQGKPTPLLPDESGRFDFQGFSGATLPNRVPGSAHHGTRGDDVALVPGKIGLAAEFDGENNITFPNLGRFTRTTPFTFAFWMFDSGAAAEPAVILQACSGTDTGPHGYDLLLERGLLSARIFRHWPGNAIGIRTRSPLPRNTWKHIALTYDGSSRAEGLRLFVDGKRADAVVLRDHLQKGTGQHTLTLAQRFRDKGFRKGKLDELAIYTRDLSALEIAQLYDGRSLELALSHPQNREGELRDYYFSAVDPETRQATAKIGALRAQVVAVEDVQTEVPVMQEMPQERPTFVLARGQYDAPRKDTDRVDRGTPAALTPFPDGAPGDRLGLARWLTQPNHPLTSRVAVNRLWSQMFGRGLVETAENFGLQGTPPTHPELLDWLAVEYIRSGWDTRAMLKRIALSATYRQSSSLRPELRRDSENRLLARGPSHRLSAEQLRDMALAASGLLDERVGGPPVSPYMPGDLWRESNVMSPAYRQSMGGDLYRRSLYSVWKRTAPMPNMLAFDAVTREYCAARRQRTNTPLQALILLNDVQFVEACRVIGERILKQGGTSSESRVRWAFRAITGRSPSAAETSVLATAYEEQRSFYRDHPAEAELFRKAGQHGPDETLPAVEVAGAAALAQVILNSDAAVWKR